MQAIFLNVPMILYAYNFGSLIVKRVLSHFHPFCSTSWHFNSEGILFFTFIFSLSLFQIHLFPFLLFLISFAKLPSASVSILSAFQRSYITNAYGKLVEDGNLKCDVTVTLFMNVDVKATRAGTAQLCGWADGEAGTFLSSRQYSPLSPQY